MKQSRPFSRSTSGQWTSRGGRCAALSSSRRRESPTPTTSAAGWTPERPTPKRFRPRRVMADPTSVELLGATLGIVEGAYADRVGFGDLGRFDEYVPRS